MMRIGYFSLPVVGLTAFFTGGALALADLYGRQSLTAPKRSCPKSWCLGITRELGPVIAGLMVAGRVAAAIAAEIGTMRVTEQIDALTTLATNPVKYLVVPRLVAAVLSMPILVAVADAIGVFGGYVVSTQSLGFTGSIYLKNTVDFATRQDVSSGLIKAAVFGFIIALMGCYQRFQFQGRRAGRGQCHHRRGGVGLDPDPGRQLSSHIDPVFHMTAKDRIDRREETLRRQGGAGRRGPHESRSNPRL